LTDTQLIVLSKAARREDKAAVAPPGLNKAAAAKVGSSLAARKLAYTRTASNAAPRASSHAACLAPHPICTHHRMVNLAKGPSSRSPKSPYQDKNATVMLGCATAWICVVHGSPRPEKTNPCWPAPSVKHLRRVKQRAGRKIKIRFCRNGLSCKFGQINCLVVQISQPRVKLGDDRLSIPGAITVPPLPDLVRQAAPA
jgi:hypothetical protein